MSSLLLAAAGCDQKDTIDVNHPPVNNGGDPAGTGGDDGGSSGGSDEGGCGIDEPPPSEDPGPEPCTADELGASRTCDDGGTQYCDTIDGANVWGDCLATIECDPGESLDCGFCDNPEDELCTICGDMTETCVLQQGVPGFGADACECNTPLVLSFDGAPVQMLDTPMATFDINDAGGCISTDWPAAATPWLALDLDRNGTIDTGRELFGSGTRLSSGERARHGFLALGELDDNHDGRIDATDSRFSELVLWSDHDADKRATFGELVPLAVRGILSLELDYQSDARCDARGNCEGQRAPFTYLAGGEVRRGEVVDVYLACQ